MQLKFYGPMSWHEAKSKEQDGWRLPNPEEMETLLKDIANQAMINVHHKNGVDVSNVFWVDGTTAARNDAYADCACLLGTDVWFGDNDHDPVLKESQNHVVLIKV